MAILNFTRETLPEASSYDPLPEGEYLLRCESCELKDTKSGGGQYLNLKCKVEGPTQVGRVIFHKLNIRNNNPKAEEIGLRQLNELMGAVGLSTLTDTAQLEGALFRGKVVIRAQEGYEPSNEVKRVKPASDLPAAPVAAPRAAPAPARPAAPPRPTPPAAPVQSAEDWPDKIGPNPPARPSWARK